ncbi:hypothetical protein ACSSWA_01335 [Melioribacter sp. Ez-97]|uniref:hypothetical protein n=1 Tax=unclassified Melioribacter TaxID=2627329 RepID=UPI003ED87551
MKSATTLIAIVILLLTPLLIFAAQTDPGGEPALDFETLFTSISGLSAGVLFFTSYAKKILNTTGNLTIAVSVLISFILSCAGYLFHVGIFAAIEWYYIFIYGLAASLIANGLSTWSFIEQLLKMLKLKTPKENGS